LEGQKPKRLMRPSRPPRRAEMVSTTCRICGRRLTNPVSVEREIGSVCLARLRRWEATVEEERLRVNIRMSGRGLEVPAE
jgi:hypothetical protein